MATAQDRPPTYVCALFVCGMRVTHFHLPTRSQSGKRVVSGDHLLFEFPNKSVVEMLTTFIASVLLQLTAHIYKCVQIAYPK